MNNIKCAMRTFSLFLITISFNLLTSCTDPDPVDTAINPFSNGGNERNMIVVVSDIHLGADITYTECNENLAALEKLLKKIKVAPNVKELVIAGDMLDEWFVPATVDIYQGKDQADFVQRIATTNKNVVDAFNSIIQEGKIRVTYVPGNHDLTITAENVDLIFPGINQARDAEQGLGTYVPVDCPVMAVEHGHRYNFFCAPDPISNQDIAPGTITPPGYFFTRIGVLSALIQKYPVPADTVPLVTLNTVGNESQYLLFVYWNVWSRTLSKYTLENKFDEKMIVTNMDGFTGTFSVNDILPYQTTAGGLIDVHLYKGIQDTWDQRQTHNRVAVKIPAAQAIANAAKSSESDDQAKMQYLLNPNSDKRIVIFGHTHVAKIIAMENHNGQKAIYANSGTWIDHNPLGEEKTFLVITPQGEDVSSQTYVRLYNFENEVVTKLAEDSLRY
jgi:UDP-2,3-diacylglucosamine pyrophosphatase LpxH